MGKTILKIIGVILGVLFIPYLFTLLVSGGFSEPAHQETSRQVKKPELVRLESVGDETMEEYITSVLAVYVPLDLELETLKAMAVIVRTNVYYKWQELITEGKEETLSKESIGLPTATMESIKQKYGDEQAAGYISTLENVIYSTKDKIITYEGQPILACYHYANAGKTRDYEESTKIPLPYLKSVDSSQDLEASVGISSLKLTYEDVAGMLEHSYDVGDLNPEKVMDEISIAKQDSTGYVMEVKVGDHTISGQDFQKCFYLNSTNFYFTEFEGNLRIICKGQGSGYGFSQYGANVLATQGQDYEQLITYYYPGAAVTMLP